eukprot:4073430-Pleurochrysis_carterae.AAC.2
MCSHRLACACACALEILRAEGERCTVLDLRGSLAARVRENDSKRVLCVWALERVVRLSLSFARDFRPNRARCDATARVGTCLAKALRWGRESVRRLRRGRRLARAWVRAGACVCVCLAAFVCGSDFVGASMCEITCTHASACVHAYGWACLPASRVENGDESLRHVCVRLRVCGG